MNQTLNMNRFWLLVRRQWTENYKVYLLLWVVMTLSLMALGLTENKSAQPLDLLLFWLGGCVVTTTIFIRWSDFGRASFYLLLPASATEKFLCGIFYSVILYVAVYCLNYFFSTYVLTYLIILFFPNNLIPFSELINDGISLITSISFRSYFVFFLSYIFVQSILMILVIRLKRMHILILAFTVLAILVIYDYGMYAWMANISHALVRAPGPVLTFLGPDFGYKSFVEESDFEYFSFSRLILILNNMLWLIIFSIIYLTAFHKLKEREL